MKFEYHFSVLCLRFVIGKSHHHRLDCFSRLKCILSVSHLTFLMIVLCYIYGVHFLFCFVFKVADSYAYGKCIKLSVISVFPIFVAFSFFHWFSSPICAINENISVLNNFKWFSFMSCRHSRRFENLISCIKY